MDCLFDKDYDVLIKSGKPTKLEKELAWQKIYTEYMDLVGDGNGNELYQKTIEINYLSSKIFAADKIVRHLQISYNEELVSILRYYGVDCGIKEDVSVEDRYKKLKLVIARIKRWMVELEVLNKAYDELQGEQTDRKGGYEYFDDALNNISMFRKYTINAKDISVRQFVKALKNMEKEAMRIASQTA